MRGTRKRSWNRKTISKMFWSKVLVADNGCWLWQRHKDKDGYGKVTIRHPASGEIKTWPAHRFAYLLVFGLIPDHLLVMHACDTPACCRPSHLSLGTPLDNMQDKIRKGRARTNQPKGMDKSNSKLTAEQVREIRLSNLSLRKLAKIYGVACTTIENAKKGRSYANVS